MRWTLPVSAAVPLVLGVWPSFASAQQATVDESVTWTRDVAPIMAEQCMNCHRPGQIGPMPLLTYEQVRPWAPSIRMMVERRRMPLGGQRSLSEEDIRTILAWVDAGAPRGEGEFATPEFSAPPDTTLLTGDLGHYNHELALRARAVRLNAPVSIDGVLDEPIWSQAFPVSNFLQTVPDEGRPASEPTDVFLAYDDDAIYVGASLEDRSPVTTRLARRDARLDDSDVLVVLLDSYHDHETAYRFWTNPSGARGDAIVTGNGTGGGDASWDPVWDVATRVSASGWTAEMRIPFSQLRFSGAERQVWGIQVERRINRNQEYSTFPFTPTLERGGVSRFAHLEGIEDIEPGRRLELLPYAIVRGEYLQPDPPSGVDFSNPYRSGSHYSENMGVDLKYRVAPSVTLDATINPDFGQVELDPSVINLTAFETRYAERRPFFVEGADVFNLGEGVPANSGGRPPQLIYSRRIGRAPRGSVPSDAAFSKIPSSTTIAGAAKMTGRVGDGWSIGVLEAVTAKETASYMDGQRGAHEVTVEPAANHLVGRVRRQIQGGQTRFGVIASAVNRSVSGTPLADKLHTAAYSGGVDFAHETEDRRWLFSTLVSGSYVRGGEEAILRTQRSSSRYYQRPDASHVELDPTRTSLSGYYAMGSVSKRAGAFTMRTGVAAVSPGYEVNDLGFQTQADQFLLDTQFRYTQRTPGKILRSWYLNVGGPDAVWNFGGERTFTSMLTSLNLVFLNYWRVYIRHRYDPWTDDDRLTRGGPLARSPSATSYFVRLDSDSRLAETARIDFSWDSNAAGGWSRRVRLDLSARLRETIQVDVGSSYSWSSTAAQYVTRIEDPLAAATYGSRYVFAPIDRTTLSLQTRLNLTFSPNLSLELYLEPFISTGDYGALKEFRSPRTFDFLEYGADVGTLERNQEGDYDIDPDGAGTAPSFQISDRDFSYRSLLGNAVLRWEWRPGSTVFFVWQQSRIDSVTGRGALGGTPWVGTFDFGRDAGDMFGAPADNIFMVKVNYWLNP